MLFCRSEGTESLDPCNLTWSTVRSPRTDLYYPIFHNLNMVGQVGICKAATICNSWFSRILLSLDKGHSDDPATGVGKDAHALHCFAVCVKMKIVASHGIIMIRYDMLWLIVSYCQTYYILLCYIVFDGRPGRPGRQHGKIGSNWWNVWKVWKLRPLGCNRVPGAGRCRFLKRSQRGRAY